jgi:hypothetical protein
LVDIRDSSNIFDSPGLPSLAVKFLLQQFLGNEQNGEGGIVEEKDDNLAKWIPKRVVWEDVPECIGVGLKREGFSE